MEAPRFDAAAVGELLVDLTQQGVDADGFPLFKANPGGAPANAMAAVARCGLSVCLIAKVGDDAMGRLLEDALARAGVYTGGLVRGGDASTTLALVTLDAAGERTFGFLRKPGADARLRPDELDTRLIDGARLLHFGSVSLTEEPARSATRAAVACAKRAGRLISFDPNLRMPLWRSPEQARRALRWGLAQADIVKLSAEEAAFLFGPCPPEEAAARILAGFGAQLVAVTLGADGCLVQTAAARVRAAAPAVRPVDTTGAGDIFTGSLLSCLLRADAAPAALGEAALCQMARYACAAASLSTERPGGLASIPAPSAVLARL